MNRRPEEIEQDRQDHATAVEKARIWRNRATVAREEGRNLDAVRCEDKARDWSSRACQIEHVAGSSTVIPIAWAYKLPSLEVNGKMIGFKELLSTLDIDDLGVGDQKNIASVSPDQ